MSGFKNRRHTDVRLRSQASTPIQSKKWNAADFGIQTSSIKILLIHGSTCIFLPISPLCVSHNMHITIWSLSWIGLQVITDLHAGNKIFIFLFEGWKNKVSKTSWDSTFCSSLQRSGWFYLLFCGSLQSFGWFDVLACGLTLITLRTEATDVYLQNYFKVFWKSYMPRDIQGLFYAYFQGVGWFDIWRLSLIAASHWSRRGITDISNHYF